MNLLAEDQEIDALLNEEEDTTFFESIRSKRIQEISSISQSISKETSSMETSTTWGYLSEIGHEKEVMHMSTTLPRLLIHFYNPAFKNCQLLNEHLNVNCYKY
jgi:hypothetical protein